MEIKELYEILYDEEEKVSEEYSCLPGPTLDLEINVSSESDTGLMALNHLDYSLYTDHSILRKPESDIRQLCRYGLVHARWHPNHGLGYRPEQVSSRAMTHGEGLSEFELFFRGRRAEVEDNAPKVRSIYQEAVEDFQTIFETDFEPPELIIEEPVTEERDSDQSEVGYRIDGLNDRIILNEEILDELQPELLNEDFRYMLKRYHDFSLQRSLENRGFPYVKSLRDQNDLCVENVYFANLEDGAADFNEERQRIRVDLSRISDFNPETGFFQSGSGSLPGITLKLHELVHDLDFTNNPETRNYSSAIGSTDIRDPRNAVLEAPTTFEVYIAGWKVRTDAVEAFKNPLENRGFFEGYPVSSIEKGEKGTIQDPYNMGLFTALTVHSRMMDLHGVEEGTDKTRDILFKNSWDLEEMERVLEGGMEYRDVPNIPRQKKIAHQALESENMEETVDEEAQRILEDIDQADNMDQLVELTLQGTELVEKYEQERGFYNPPDALWELDAEVVFLRDTIMALD